MKTVLLSQLKKGYSAYVRGLSKRATNQQMKKQVVYLLSFPNNDHGLIDALHDSFDLTVCFTKNMSEAAKEYQEKGMKVINIDTLSGLVETVKVVTASQIIIADNYFAFLGDIKKRPNKHFVQLWHATGAIKKFGLEDKQAQKRSKEDQNRFNRVYQSFDYFVVSSEAMGEVFSKSYGAKKSQMLYLGFPRTDYLLEATKIDSGLKEKTQLLYLPTYREGEKKDYFRDAVTLVESLGDEYELYLKLHPHESLDEVKEHDRVRIVDSAKSSDELLLEADCLITDYSSVAFDYSLINPLGKLVFYWYDEASYDEITGIQSVFKETMPSPVCHRIEDVVTEIKSMDDNLDSFNQIWNTYNDGQATIRLVDWVKQEMSE